jgi:hypothetical protein
MTTEASYVQLLDADVPCWRPIPTRTFGWQSQRSLNQICPVASVAVK